VEGVREYFSSKNTLGLLDAETKEVKAVLPEKRLQLYVRSLEDDEHPALPDT